MKAKKILCGVLGAAITLSAGSVFASFSDVDGDATVQWAKPYIDEMANLGYIKGYEDGTFKPNKTISKAEALVLLSRMIGVNDDEYAKTAEYALNKYKSTIEKYSAEYENEVAFLLYRGILKESELSSYISVSNRSVALKRYEAAILLTKILGDEEEVLDNAFVSSSYADTLEIPDSARAYVEYVKEKGIMQGMGSTAAGDIFSPNTGVTRSQMAKMLCSLIDVLEKSSDLGTIVSINNAEEKITVSINGYDMVVEVPETAKIKIDGADESFGGLHNGMEVRISYLNGKVSLIENVAVVKDTTLKGVVASVKEASGSQVAATITIADSEDTSKKQTYSVSKSVKVIIGGAVDSFSKLKVNNYVEITVKDGEVCEVEVIDKTQTVTGTLKKVDISNGETVLIIEHNSNEESYPVSSSSASVSRNSLDARISDLVTGDSVVLRLTYGKVTKITAESSTQNSTGVINYIKHSVEGTTVGISLNGKVTEYKVNKSATVLIDSDDGDVYDLRPGSDIKIKLESSEIVKLETSTSISSSQISGTVKSVNATYGLIIIETGGKEYNVFTNSNTKIIDSATGDGMKIKNLEKNSKVSITGSNTSGVYEATVIVIQ